MQIAGESELVQSVGTDTTKAPAPSVATEGIKLSEFRNAWHRSIVRTMIAFQQENHHRLGADVLAETLGWSRDSVIDEAKKAPELNVEENFGKAIVTLA
ncbi:MAG: hypothetical protein DWQ19_12825 [Crenarchaeota archaeon]|nr:MAG: hypothetical protein DWQ19_12825 [Thermoproteota archaeon]